MSLASKSSAFDRSAGAFQKCVPPALAQILRRSSVAPKTLVAPAPDEAELELIVAAALTAPDHENLRPFRFIFIRGAGREALAQTFIDIKKERDPRTHKEQLARTWKKTMRAPCLLAVIAALDYNHAKVPVHEQYMTVGGAIFAVLLACQQLGYGAIMLSGSRSRHPLVRDLLGIAPHEGVVGFISVGTPSKAISPKQRPDPRDFLAIWQGDAQVR